MSHFVEILRLDYALARMCQDAYRETPDVAAIERGGMRATVTPWGGDLYIAFRGSVQTPADFYADLSAWPARDKVLGWCDAGFLRATDVLWPGIAEAVRAMPARGALYITGHSLGGAMAVLTALLLHAEGRMPAGVVTFGAPRALLGWAPLRPPPFPTRQYRDGNDPVPTVPWGYHHLTTLTRIGSPDAEPVRAHPIQRYAAALQRLTVEAAA